MPAELRLTGILKQNYYKDQNLFLTDISNTIYEILLHEFGLNKKELDYLVVVNGTLRDEKYVPVDNDVIEIIPLVAAG